VTLDPPTPTDDDIAAAATAIADGELVVYPTETVYGLGADASSADAVERVFETKGRSRDKPLSLGVPDVETARRYTRLTDCDERFISAFLPGPVTVVVEAAPSLPDVLTAGRDRVGLRIPNHDLALDLYRAAKPLPVTATSANLSGHGSVRRVDELSAEVRDACAVVLDGGETDGSESTVVDPGRGIVHRRGAHADRVEAWLADHADE
jgi:L-threonylcarbamoyladenylate synthase